MDHALNWLWQGCAIALATSVVLHLAARSRAHDRYVIGWVALSGVLALPLVSWLLDGMLPPPATPRSTEAVPPAVLSVPTVWWTSATTVVALGMAWFAFSMQRLVVM